MQTTEIILQENGTLVERVTRERELDAGQSVLDALTEGVARTQRNVLSLPDWGVAHASAGSLDTIWTVLIDRIPLHARFRLVNGVLVPAFGSATDMEMPLVWRAPDEVRLAFVVRTEFSDGCVRIGGNWLFACDRERRGYRLPLPNLHDDCLICTGNFQDRHDTCGECLTASLEQFRKSRWNADLMRTVERSQQFFRFRPTNETFETLPIEAADWTALCDKVSTQIMERVLV